MVFKIELQEKLLPVVLWILEFGEWYFGFFVQPNLSDVIINFVTVLSLVFAQNLSVFLSKVSGIEVWVNLKFFLDPNPSPETSLFPHVLSNIFIKLEMYFVLLLYSCFIIIWFLWFSSLFLMFIDFYFFALILYLVEISDLRKSWKKISELLCSGWHSVDYIKITVILLISRIDYSLLKHFVDFLGTLYFQVKEFKVLVVRVYLRNDVFSDGLNL